MARRNLSGSSLLRRLSSPPKNKIDGPGAPKRGDSAYWKRVARQRGGGAAAWPVLVPWGSRNASGLGASVAIPNTTQLKARLEVMSSSGAGTMDVRIETSNDGAAWTTAGNFPQRTAGQPGTPDEITLPVSLGAGGLVRAGYTIGGAGSYLFQVSAVKLS